jgi:hypothetical protein
MCRSIKVLRKPGQSATDEELYNAALQFVRKISGFNKPSKANEEAFLRAIDEVAHASGRLLETIASNQTRHASATD